jgi:hypothetical protein
MRSRTLAVALACAVALPGCATLRGTDNVAPEQKTEELINPEALEKFQKEVEEYVELHQELLHRIPNVSPGATPEQIAAHRLKMETAIREERKGAKRGEIFKPKVEAAFRALLRKQFTGPGGAALLDDIKQGNPRVEGVPQKSNPRRETKEPVTVAVNAVYNDDAPFSSMPPSILLTLPRLPEQVKYRFVGRSLILRDGEANVILDFIPDIVPDRSMPR